jgi:hypothetical protein
MKKLIVFIDGKNCLCSDGHESWKSTKEIFEKIYNMLSNCFSENGHGKDERMCHFTAIKIINEESIKPATFVKKHMIGGEISLLAEKLSFKENIALAIKKNDFVIVIHDEKIFDLLIDIGISIGYLPEQEQVLVVNLYQQKIVFVSKEMDKISIV